jgi:hypothetical protein
LTTTQARPTLVVYKEIVGGDMRKLLAESNDDPSQGGGARDLRFPTRAFDPVLRLMFNKDKTGPRGQAIRVGNFLYLDHDGKPDNTELEYWPPTNTRKSESRIARIHASPALGGQLPATDKGKVFVLLTRFSDHTVRCDYAYENELRNPNIWAKEISSRILNCLASACVKNANRTTGLVPAQGYYDFSNATGYCHAD